MTHTTMPWLDGLIDRIRATNSLPREDLDDLVNVIVLLEMKLRALSMSREKCIRCEANEILLWLRTRERNQE